MKLSLILPVYNARDYIIPCLESFANQSLPDVELVVVDDHGTDGTMEAVVTFQENYAGKKEFKFVSTSVNSGPGAARNVGIEAAEGEYVAFLDSDDWIEADFCESLYKAAHKRDADLAYCHIAFDDRTGEKSRVGYNPVVSNGDFTVKKHRYFLSKYVSYFTTFIYKRSFLIDNALRFPGTRSSEDSAFLACCLLSAKRIAVVEKPLYHYVVRSSSLSTTTDGGRYLQKLQSFDEMTSYAIRHDLYEPYKEEIDFIYIKKAALMAVYSYVANTDKPESSVVREIHDRLTEKIPDYRSNRYLRRSCKLRLIVSLIRRHPWLATKVMSRRARKASRI